MSSKKKRPSWNQLIENKVKSKIEEFGTVYALYWVRKHLPELK